MSHEILRSPLESEIPALQHIWRSAFGEDAAMESFFARWFDPCLAVVAVSGGEPVSAGYLLPLGNLAAQSHSIPCAELYALATLPEHRGHGYGEEVSRELFARGWNAGYGAVAICPANDTLFDYYKTRMGSAEFFYVYERFAAPECAAKKITRVTAGEYALLRERHLVDLPHIAMSEEALCYQEVLCRIYGGGLFAGGQSCAVVERQESGEVIIKELLSPDGEEGAFAAALASEFPSKRYLFRTPFYRADARQRRFGLLSLPPEAPELSSGQGWFGLAFD